MILNKLLVLKRDLGKTNITSTVFFSLFIFLIYIKFEGFYYSDFGCGCSSLCWGHYVSKSSKIIGHCLIFFSSSTIIASIWRIKRLSVWWAIPSIIIFLTALYGNGYMLYNKGPCGLSMNKTMFYVFSKKLGDFAKADGESLNLDSLEAHKYDGKLLGYHFIGNDLTIYRIADKPIEIKTRFLFWQLDKDEIIKDISYGLNSYMNRRTGLEKEKTTEFIGGMNMTIEAFIDELKFIRNWDFKKVKKKEIVNSNDGTTRLYLTYD